MKNKCEWRYEFITGKLSKTKESSYWWTLQTSNKTYINVKYD